MSSVNLLAPLACAAPMGLMFWMMNRDRTPRDERNHADTDRERARSDDLTSLQNEVARLREQSGIKADDVTDPRSP